MRTIADLTGLPFLALSGVSNEGITWVSDHLIGLDPDFALLDAINFALGELNNLPMEKRDIATTIRQEYLHRAREQIVLSRNLQRSRADFTHSPNKDFAQEFSEWHWQNFLENENSQILKAGHRRSAEYARTIGKFPSTCSSLYLADPYASVAIANHEVQPGRTWLLRKLLTDAENQSFVIETALPPELLSASNFFRVSDKVNHVLDKFAGLLKKVGPRQGPVTLRVLNWSKSNFHSRTLGFYPELGSFGITLDKGIDDFAQDPLPRNLPLQFLTAAQLKSQRANLNPLGLLAEHTFS
jgi:hypothetical protein